MYFQTHFKKSYLSILSFFLVVLILCTCCSRCGGAPNASASDEPRSIPVLMYHSVCINQRIDSEYIITPEKFREDMEYLKNRGYTFVSLPAIYDFYTGNGSLPEKCAAITFDDGFLNNLTEVLPVLQELDIPANINIVGSYTDNYSMLHERDESYACLTWDDVKTLAQSGKADIGCHTWDMHYLGTRRGCARQKGESDEAYRAVLREDLRRFDQALREHCGMETKIFAYPYGEVSDISKEVLAEEGFTILLTCEEKFNRISPSGGGTLVLGRINRASSPTTKEFMKTTGL